MGWQITHGQVIGGYLKVRDKELYVREVWSAGDFLGWAWYVNGRMGGVEINEYRARAKAEAAVRPVLRAHPAPVAATAR